MKIYKGTANNGDWYVTVDGQSLPERLDLANHSPDGFAWGYGGSGPAQLALAILADLKGDMFALRVYQDFKTRVIARLDRDKDWEMSSTDVDEYLDEMPVRARSGHMAWGAGDVDFS